MSKRYEFPVLFSEVYRRAVEAFAEGRRTPATLVNAADRAFLEETGIGVQALLDYAEDQNNYGEPGLEHALAIETIRRDYFLNVQLGRPTGRVLDDSKLPEKTAAVQGIEWLPRLLPKARAKLAGELPHTLMFCCGGDRRFFKNHDIAPADFLAAVARHRDDKPIIEWVGQWKK
ncbi:DUF5069 domain-containing protein [Nibricoccus sp. IMCC34717]|uniref:DUF5069 domain-containing protein n=1 Tax=Nibricoccus sp. IMCC34717 TaxID=3034021 RepID=UPI00385054C0